MTAETRYFALLRDGDDISRPRTILRRRATPEVAVDEILRGDGTWHNTGILMLSEMNMYEHDAKPISATAAHEFERWVHARLRAGVGAAE